MRYVIALIAVAAVLTFACDDEREEPGATATPRGSPATPSEHGDLEGFRDFAQQIEQAILAKDSQFFVERAVLQELTCSGDETLAPCEGQPAGTTIRGVPGGIFQSDASNLSPPEEYAQALERYFSAALVDESDQYGSGSLLLYALARTEQEGNMAFMAITTSIVDTYPTGFPIGTSQREAHLFSFELDEGRWQFTGEGVAVNSASSSNWLSGECDDCYDHWERWEGHDGASDSGAQAGNSELDAVVHALQSGDPEELRPLISFTSQPCASEGLGLPLCGPGQPEGTLVDVFLVGMCEGTFYGPDQLDSIATSLSSWQFYALYDASNPLSFLPGVQYVAVTFEDSSGFRSARSVEIADNRIVQAVQSCPPVPPEQYVLELGLTAAVVPPIEGGTSR